MKIQDGGFLGALVASLAASLVQTVISYVQIVKGISGRSARRGYINKIF